jgi:NAD(P)-dependent dehydrogenase (short-subunit alcohol dehydrogenase family)
MGLSRRRAGRALGSIGLRVGVETLVMKDLAGKTAVVTGAASGMGRAFAERFADAGMNVVLADVEVPRLEEAAASVTGRGVDAITVATDVSDADAFERLRDEALARFGRVHVVCNNAGVAGSMTGGEIDLNDWRWVLGVNLWGVIHGHRSFLPHLLEHGDGHIVNTASMAGHHPGHSAYAASKWAVVALSEGLYQQLRMLESTVGVSCLCPGWVATDIGSSERNRPEWAAPRPLDERPVDERAVVAREWALDQLKSGMPPAQVAELVHDAVVNDRFWIFTDMTMVAALEPRYGAILAGENPPAVSLIPRD